jgi:hypothetical protein
VWDAFEQKATSCGCVVAERLKRERAAKLKEYGVVVSSVVSYVREDGPSNCDSPQDESKVKIDTTDAQKAFQYSRSRFIESRKSIYKKFSSSSTLFSFCTHENQLCDFSSYKTVHCMWSHENISCIFIACVCSNKWHV